MSFKWMPVFSTGVWMPKSGQKFEATAERIKRIVDATKKSAGKLIPFVFNHPQPVDERAVTFGGFDANNVRVNGNLVEILPSEIRPEIAEQFNAGKFKGVSIRIGHNDEIQHVGFLTDSPPAVKNLPAYQFEGADFEEFEITQFADSRMSEVGYILRAMRERMIEKEGIEEADKVFSSWRLDELMQWRPEVPEWLTAELDALRVKLDKLTAGNNSVISFTEGKMTVEELQAKLQAVEAENTRLTAENMELAEKKRIAEFEQFCDAGDMKGRITPAMRPKVVEIMKHLEDVSVVEFSDGSKSTALGMFKDVLKHMPIAIDFNSPTMNNPMADRGGDSDGVTFGKMYNERKGIK